jgi:hypothetical protein
VSSQDFFVWEGNREPTFRHKAGGCWGSNQRRTGRHSGARSCASPESICGRPPCRKMLFGVRSDRLHPYVRPVGAGVTAGQDGFRDASSKQPSDLSSANGFHGVSRTLDRSIPTISSLAAPASIGSASREGTPTRPISVTRRSPMPSACAPRDSSRPLP